MKNDKRLKCFDCGKIVSTEVPDDTIVRALIQCPECMEKQTKTIIEPKLDDLRHQIDFIEAQRVVLEGCMEYREKEINHYYRAFHKMATDLAIKIDSLNMMCGSGFSGRDYVKTNAAELVQKYMDETKGEIINES